MKKNEIKVGGHYRAKVNGQLVTVRVDKIYEGGFYDVTNLATGRKTTFRSAAKFRREVVRVKCPSCGKTVNGLTNGTCYECKIRGSDPTAEAAGNTSATAPASEEKSEKVENGFYRCTRCSFGTKYLKEMANHERRLPGHNMEFIERGDEDLRDGSGVEGPQDDREEDEQGSDPSPDSTSLKAPISSKAT